MTRMSILKVAAVVASETAEKIGYFWKEEISCTQKSIFWGLSKIWGYLDSPQVPY